MGVELTIIGLGQIGASIGLALAKDSLEINRTGHDANPGAESKTQKMGAVDRIERNIHQAVNKADLVILATPADEVRETLELIRNDLQPGAVIIDTSPLKTSVFAWAEELLPLGQTFVSFSLATGTAYLQQTETGTEAAHADLFKGAVALINAPPTANPDVVRLAGELAHLLGCKPLFTDAREAEGLLATGQLLPFLVSAALVNAVSRQPGWREARKVADKAFFQVTKPLEEMDGSALYGQSAILNRENAVRVLDNLTTEIQTLRELIVRDDGASLNKLLHDAEQERRLWWEQRVRGEWEERQDLSGIPSAGEMFSRFFGFRRKKPAKMD
ncbi:MAG: prephenate dehydrogenase [Anaerolineaceae bacterium]|nr:prephenate dehydrogenase [Anaerolineaceae bacterium]